MATLELTAFVTSAAAKVGLEAAKVAAAGDPKRSKTLSRYKAWPVTAPGKGVRWFLNEGGTYAVARAAAADGYVVGDAAAAATEAEARAEAAEKAAAEKAAALAKAAAEL